MTEEEQKHINDRFKRIEEILERNATSQTKRDEDEERKNKARNEILDRIIVSQALLDKGFERHEKSIARHDEMMTRLDARLDRIALGLEYLLGISVSVHAGLRLLSDSFESHRKDPHGHDDETGART